MERRTLLTAGAALLTTSALPFSRAGATEFITFGGGSTGGSFHIISAGMARVVEQNVPNVRATARVTSATIENTRLLGQKRIEFATGAAFDAWTLEDEDAGRGRRYALVIVDEAAMARNLRTVWEQAIRPTLTDLAGGAWFFSTPKGRNYFHELYTRGGSPAWPGWRSHHAPTLANPYISPDEVAEARRGLPERIFAQEYEAAFLEEASARREAERGTFDPTYLVYSAGKMMLLKLRHDWYEEQGGKPSLRAFHDALLSHGAAPFRALRRLMLASHHDDVLE